MAAAKRLTPGRLLVGHVYETPMGEGGLVRIESVGPKWITFRELKGTGIQDASRGRGLVVDRRGRVWGPKRRLLRSGWEGPLFSHCGDR